MASLFSFTIPVGDSADLALTLADSPSLAGWSVTFTAGTVVKTSGAGEITIGTPTGGITIQIDAGDFSAAGTVAASVVAALGLEQLTWYGTIAVTNAASNGDLTTLAKVRAYLKGEFSNPGYTDHDAELSRLITSVSADVKTRTDRALAVPATTKTERVNGTGGTSLRLREWPVNAVSSVVIDGDTIPSQPDAQSDGWYLDGNSLELVGYTFTSGRGNVAITYTHGWATVPTDLEQAVIQLVALAFVDADHVGVSTKSLSGGDTVTWNGGPQLVNAGAVIDRYTRVAFA